MNLNDYIIISSFIISYFYIYISNLDIKIIIDYICNG